MQSVKSWLEETVADGYEDKEDKLLFFFDVICTEISPLSH